MDQHNDGYRGKEINESTTLPKKVASGIKKIDSRRLENKLALAEQSINEALEIVEKYGSTDGAHHKQWVIDQMVRKLLGTEYERWRSEYGWDFDLEEQVIEGWDEGKAP